MKIGDVVQLKSGGPRMTVHTLDNDMDDSEAEVTCMWFDEKQEQHVRVFKVLTLKTISDS